MLTQLLNGTHFNFIIVDSPQNPNEPTQILLSLQKNDGDATTVSAAPPQPAPFYIPTPAPMADVLPPQYDNSLKAPSEPVSPDALGELMKAKAHELLEKIRQEAPPQ